MGQVLGALRFAFFEAIPDQLFAKLPEPDADLTGRTFIVTGANTGIGFAAALHLARLNPAHIVLAVRDTTKGQAAQTAILEQTGFSGVLDVWALDMADFGSVRRFAERANTSLQRLDGALLNAGINARGWEVTGDGWEKMFQVNALSTGLLALLLLPLLNATSSRPDASPHLTITGSAGMFFSTFAEQKEPRILPTLNDPAKNTNGDRYPVTKLFNLYIAREIVKLPKAKGVVVNVVDPGMCVSELQREYKLGAVLTYLYHRLGWPSSKGALNLLYAALTPTPPGAYVGACRVRSPPAWSNTKEGLGVQRRAWHEMVEVWRGVAPEVGAVLDV
ncbi:hypothetical protein C8R43DRAFT_1038667 [Mycena crocata]|nr:hypothetical protein C8R43DRAFT_1038667 [Mycena crocata]